ncbi:VanZ family protein [Duganella sp. PWIR1]
MTEDKARREPVRRSRLQAVRGIVCLMLKLLLLTSAHARLRYWTAIVLYLLILVLGSIPGARKDIGEVATGVILHSIAYAGLAFLIFTGSTGSLAQRAAKAVLTIALMGALDEYVQSFFPYRHGAVSDWLVDCNAAVLASAFMWALWSRYRILPAN